MLAPTFAWRPRPATELIVFAEYQKEDTQIDSGIPVLPGGAIPDVPFSRYYGERFTTFEVPVYRLRYVFEHKLTANWSLRSLAGIEKADDKQNKADFTGFEDDGRTLNREFQRERGDGLRYSIQNEAVGRLNTGAVAHTVLAGIEYSSDDQRGVADTFELDAIDIFDPVYAGTFGPATERLQFAEKLNAVGIFVQDQIRFSDAWILVGGARFDRYRRTDRLSGTDVGALNASVEEQAVSPRIGIVHHPLQGVSLYASYAESFRPQIGLQQNGRPVDAEQGKQYEAGIKLDLFENRASATLALFRIAKANVLATDPDETNFVLQTGKQRSRGIELDVAGEVAAGWKVIGALGFVDAEVESDALIAAGTRLANAPRWSGRLWSTYRFRNGPLAGLTIGGGATSVGNRNGSLFAPYNVPGYTRFDAFLSYRLSDSIKFSLNLENLADKKYINSADPDAFHPGAPFSIFGKVEFRL